MPDLYRGPTYQFETRRFRRNFRNPNCWIMTLPNIRLDELGQGESAIIVEIIGDDVVASRLMEMGLIEDEPISMVGRAPMGDPTEYAVRGYRISLRKNESTRVIVRKES